MRKLHNSELTELSKELRKNMTKEECHLWYDFLKDLSVQFYRQRTFGNYIVDFYCPTVKLIVELDGSQHYDEQGVSSDRVRNEYLRSQGLTLLRYSNHDIWNRFESVCQDIWNHIYGSAQ